jgi:hypothetical protein
VEAPGIIPLAVKEIMDTIAEVSQLAVEGGLSCVGAHDVRELDFAVTPVATHCCEAIQSHPTLLSLPQSPHRAFLIRCSYIEIYNEKIADLLAADGAPDTVEVREHKERVRGGGRAW